MWLKSYQPLSPLALKRDSIRGNRDEHKLSRHRDDRKDRLSHDFIELISHREARFNSSGHE